MLERASICIDPAAYQLFRKIEVPARSARLLHPKFWRQGSDDIQVPAWWPVYLQKVRASSESRYNAQIGGSNSASLPCAATADPPRRRYPPARSDAISRSLHPVSSSRDGYGFSRTYSRSAPRTAELSIANSLNDIGDRVENLPDERSNATADGYRGYEPIPSLSFKNEAKTGRLQELLRSQDVSGSDEVWRIFIRLKSQKPFALQVLELLSKSTLRVDRKRALRVYSLIEIEDRTSVIYETTARIAARLQDRKFALSIMREALSRNLGFQTSRAVLSKFVQDLAWVAASKAWNLYREFVPTSSNGSGKTLPVSIKPNQDLKFSREDSNIWQRIDTMPSLSEKIYSLVQRLKSDSAVLLPHQDSVRRLAVALLHRLVQSQQVLGNVTGKGLLEVLFEYHELNLLEVHHYIEALRTCSVTKDTRNRGQLSLLLYRNLRFRFPDFKPPRWMIGSLISIATETQQPAATLMAHLNEFAAFYGKPDQLAYQKVMVACARQGSVTLVSELYKRLCSDHGKPFNLTYLTPLLYVHAVLGDVEQTRAQFDQLESVYNFTPNTYCWNILLFAHSRAQDLEGALSTFKTMLSMSIAPDSYTFGTLMGTSSNAGDTHAVHRLVELAKKYRIPGTTAMVDTLVQSYCNDDELEQAERLVEVATNMNLKGSLTRMWNILLRYHAFRADSENLLRTQVRMRECGVAPDGMTYAALMSALVVIRKTRDAAQILRTLHLNKQLEATLFHYSIVLQGYVLEGKRDDAVVIYNEILNRFPRASASGRLSMLRLQADRDVGIQRRHQVARGRFVPLRMPHSLKFLAEVLHETSLADVASKEPQPGFQRRPAKIALPSVFIESMVHALGSNESVTDAVFAEELLGRYQALIDSSYLNQDQKMAHSIQILSAHLTTCVRQRSWDRTKECWNRILSKALSSVPNVLSVDDLAPQKPSHFGAEMAAKEVDQTKSTFSSEGKSTVENLYSGAAGFHIPTTHRFILSVPLSKYMLALAEEGLTVEAAKLVERLEKLGFVLTGKNWNSFVQCLTKSPVPQHQLRAFEIFEQKLLPGAPNWSILIRGKWKDPSGAELLDREGEVRRSLLSSRRSIEKTRPGQLLPTYYTAIYLGTALMKFFRRGAEGHEMDVEYLRRRAPGTLRLIEQMPYLQDKVQGLLLRGRELKGGTVPRPRQAESANRAGLLGSKSPLDHVPLDQLLEIESRIASYIPLSPKLEKTHRKRTSTPSADLVELGERVTGEILQSRAIQERRGRKENDQRFLHRLGYERKQKSAVAEQLRAEARFPRLTTDVVIGQPHFQVANPEDSAEDWHASLIHGVHTENNALTGPAAKAVHIHPHQALEAALPTETHASTTLGDSSSKRTPRSPLVHSYGQVRSANNQAPIYDRSTVSSPYIYRRRGTVTRSTLEISKLLNMFAPPRRTTLRDERSFSRNKTYLLAARSRRQKHPESNLPGRNRYDGPRRDIKPRMAERSSA